MAEVLVSLNGGAILNVSISKLEQTSLSGGTSFRQMIQLDASREAGNTRRGNVAAEVLGISLLAGDQHADSLRFIT